MLGAARRRILRWLAPAVAIMVALAIPVAALASGGGSAGDQQYTDPFAGSPTTATHASPTTTVAQTTTLPAATSAPPVSSATAAPGSTIAPTASDPTATTARTTLPYTGFSGWLAGALGFTLVGTGVLLRRRLRRG